ncbi:MAG: hypothetical protein ACO1OB_05785 [Archangium sp.]
MSRLAVCFLVGLSLMACRDHDAEALARAEFKYRDLIAAGTRPEDPKFDPVLDDLKQVSSTSRQFERAQKLRTVLEAARAGRVRTPLALGGKGTRPPELEAQLAACARLAQLAGADGGVDRAALEALEKCRHQAELMELQFAHGDEHEDGGAHP